MNMPKTLPIACLVLAVSAWSSLALRAGEITFLGTTDKETALYQPGEKMTFTVKVFDDGKPAPGQKVKWVRTGDDGKTENGEAVVSEAAPLVVSTSLDVPGFVRLEVAALDADGKPIPAPDGKHPTTFNGGAGVEIDKLQGVPEPDDFDAFWARQKTRLAAMPPKVTMTEIPSTNPDFVAFDVRVECPGGKPVSGYLTKPKNAAPKSLKAHDTFQGYGVHSASLGYEKDTLLLNINAHGIENGKDADFYKALADGELKGYAFNNAENAKPETSYFNGMVLRVLRSLEFLKSQPEWNGKDLLVSGGSQGGFQSLVAAALDKNVTLCNVGVPWLCDLGGITLGRLRGGRPDFADGLRYYDSANMAKRIACPVTISAGLGDYTCPPSGVCVLYNNLAGPKTLDLIQGKTHPYTPPPGGQHFVLKANQP